MKYIHKISLVAGAALLAVLPVLLISHGARASGTATMSLSPSSTTVGSGASFNVAIHENSGSDLVNAVQANLSYSNNLTFVSITDSPSFNISAQSTGGGGSVKIGRGTATPVSGDQVVATVKFTASGSGTGTVTFASGSAVVRSTDNGAESLTFQNGSYSITSSATLNLSPANKTVSQGTAFDVQVYGDSGGDSVNAVQVNLSYPTSVLNCTGVTGNSTDWPIEAQNICGSGSVNIGRGTTSPLTGSHLIATVHFTGSGAGTASVPFVSGTGMVRSTDNTAEPSTNTGGNYTVTSTTTSGGTGSGGGTSSGGGTTSSGTGTTSNSTSKKTTSGTSSKTSSPPVSVTTAPTAKSTPVTQPVDSTGPQISDIKAVNVTTKSATITWTTSEPATSEVDFGLDTQYILSASDSKLTTDHSVTLDPKQLVPHKKFHYIVKSVDAAGNQSVSDDLTFSTGGLQVTTTEIAITGGAALLGAVAWLAAAGGLKLGGGAAASAASAGSTAGIFSGAAAGGPTTTAPPDTVIKPESGDPNVIHPQNPGSPG